MSRASVEIDVEHQRSHEIERDEDVLSLELQQQLETVGSAVGVVAAVALVASHVTRALRFPRARTQQHARTSHTGGARHA